LHSERSASKALMIHSIDTVSFCASSRPGEPGLAGYVEAFTDIPSLHLFTLD